MAKDMWDIAIETAGLCFVIGAFLELLAIPFYLSGSTVTLLVNSDKLVIQAADLVYGGAVLLVAGAVLFFGSAVLAALIGR